MAIAIGEPFYVSPDSDDDGLERARQDLQQRLFALESRARELLTN
jgi:hypothetical protein